MTSAQEAEVCRVSVFGPKGRADFAVPLAVSVVSLLPVLLKRTSDPVDSERQPGSWVLQRLGEAPMDPVGTPESLDWRDGDELYLRPADDPLPELDFDDIANGMATAVSRHAGRWRPEFNRRLFFGFSVAALTILGRALLYPGAETLSVVGGVVVAVALLIGAVVAGGRTQDRALILLLGLAGCVFAGATGAVAPAGIAAAIDLQGNPVLAAGLAMAFAAALMLTARAIWARAVPFAPFGVFVAVGVLAVISQWLHLVLGFTPAQTSGLLSTILVGVLVFAPKLAIRFARIRGPQLPRTAEELQRDIDPMPAVEVAAKTRYADDYLTITAVASSVVFACAFPFLTADGVFGGVLTLLTAVAVILRARAFLGAWQRVSLAVAGGFGLAVISLSMVTEFTGTMRGVSLASLAVVFVLLLAAMVRPPTQRLLPIWGHLANGLETVSAIAVIPLLLQLFGVYSWAHGLAG